MSPHIEVRQLLSTEETYEYMNRLYTLVNESLSFLRRLFQQKIQTRIQRSLSRTKI